MGGVDDQPVASTINTLAGALYQVLSDPANREMREACFDYLSLGGMYSEGAVALLSGLNPRPMSLVAHFFAVAVYGVGRLILPFPSPKSLSLGLRLLMVGELDDDEIGIRMYGSVRQFVFVFVQNAYGIIFPIVRSEGVRQMFFPITIPAAAYNTYTNTSASVVMKTAMFDMMA